LPREPNHPVGCLLVCGHVVFLKGHSPLRKELFRLMAVRSSRCCIHSYVHEPSLPVKGTSL
jgi:hypothetical protein